MKKLTSTAFVIFLFALSTLAVTAFANPCLIIYPTGLSKYHYDVNEYYTVSYGHPLYDPMYDRGGQVLIDINTDEIAYNIYQAPNLNGFVPSSNGKEGYFFIASSFDLIIDGFSNEPTFYENILLVFEPDPEWCTPVVTVDGEPLLGNTLAIGNLEVSTPTAEGNNYSDTLVKQITWSGCYGIEIWAFADQDYNGQLDGNECFTAFSHDVSVPTQEISWGAVKSLYRE